jgi:hypothetical protein
MVWVMVREENRDEEKSAKSRAEQSRAVRHADLSCFVIALMARGRREVVAVLLSVLCLGAQQSV